jgi:hypothetical protein
MEWWIIGILVFSRRSERTLMGRHAVRDRISDQFGLNVDVISWRPPVSLNSSS